MLSAACIDDAAPQVSGGSTSGTTEAMPVTSSTRGTTGDLGTTSSTGQAETSTTSGSSSTSSTSGESTSSTGGTASTGSSGSTGEDRVLPRVLLVGNSYTAGNGLAGLVTQLSASLGTPLHATAIAPGGGTLESHWNTPTTVDALGDPELEAVVLQGQSLEPWLANTNFQMHAELLGTTACDAGARVFFFETWARQAGNSLYEDSVLTDNTELQQILRDAYQAAADASCAEVAPVGDAWEDTWTQHPAIELYLFDGAHPALAGSYLAAAVLVESIAEVDTSLEAAWAPDGLDADVAQTLRTLAHCRVTGC